MKRTLKEKVIANARKQRQEKRKQQEELFKQKYSKSLNYEFPPVDEIDMNRHFYFPKFPEGSFMTLPAIAIYPVLCVQADFEQNNWFQISQSNIATMAGVSINTAAKGIKDLERYKFDEDTPILEKQKKTEGQRHFYVYRINFIRKDDIEESKGWYFIFHKCIIESGVWSDLTPRAKALYLSMRMNAHFDVELYVDLEDLDLEYESPDVNIFYHSDEYRNRKWDVCYTSIAELCRKVDITPTNLKPILKQLENHRLIERVDENKSHFKVYLKPKIRAYKV